MTVDKNDFQFIDEKFMEDVANKTYPGLTIYVKDLNLPNILADKYVKGMIICEKAFVDASKRVMGMITTHRYMILSNHMADFSQFEHGTNWNLHVANKNSHYKVLGKHTYNGKTAIILLHLPDDETWKVYKKCEFSVDEEFYNMAVESFEKKCELPPVPELTTEAWLSRCDFPIGMSDDGTLFDL